MHMSELVSVNLDLHTFGCIMSDVACKLTVLRMLQVKHVPIRKEDEVQVVRGTYKVGFRHKLPRSTFRCRALFSAPRCGALFCVHSSRDQSYCSTLSC